MPTAATDHWATPSALGSLRQSFPMKLRLVLNSQPFCLILLGSGTANICHHLAKDILAAIYKQQQAHLREGRVYIRKQLVLSPPPNHPQIHFVLTEPKLNRNFGFCVNKHPKKWTCQPWKLGQKRTVSPTSITLPLRRELRWGYPIGKLGVRKTWQEAEMGLPGLDLYIWQVVSGWGFTYFWLCSVTPLAIVTCSHYPLLVQICWKSR